MTFVASTYWDKSLTDADKRYLYKVDSESEVQTFTLSQPVFALFGRDFEFFRHYWPKVEPSLIFVYQETKMLWYEQMQAELNKLSQQQRTSTT